jgi:hypothetical protein
MWLDFDLQDEADQEYKMNILVRHIKGGYRHVFINNNNKKKVSSTGKKILLTHNYGHGGSGYQSSWGSCQEAVNLIQTGYSVIKNERLQVKQLLSRL